MVLLAITINPRREATSAASDGLTDLQMLPEQRCKSSTAITTVRLKIEQIQLVGSVKRFSLGRIDLQGA